MTTALIILTIAFIFLAHRVNKLTDRVYKTELDIDWDLVKKEEIAELNKRINLILEHLNVSYQPPTETKEPAKLVDKPYGTFMGIDCFIADKGFKLPKDFGKMKSELKKPVAKKRKK